MPFCSSNSNIVGRLTSSLTRRRSVQKPSPSLTADTGTPWRIARGDLDVSMIGLPAIGLSAAARGANRPSVSNTAVSIGFMTLLFCHLSRAGLMSKRGRGTRAQAGIETDEALLLQQKAA